MHPSGPDRPAGALSLPRRIIRREPWSNGQTIHGRRSLTWRRRLPNPPIVDLLPPLDCLRFFEAAARHESFARAGGELGVTPAAVAHRVRMLEQHLGDALFDRGRRSVRLNRRGRAYLAEVQRILADLRSATERHGRRPGGRLRIVSIEGVAENWLLPRLLRFKTAHPDVAVELETHHGDVDPSGRDFDFWLTYVTEGGPQLHRIPDALPEDVLLDDPMLPFCSPALIEAHGRPDAPADLLDWPLLYHLGREPDWPYWFARNGAPAPDLAGASGFRVYGMLVQAALDGLGAALGGPSVIAGEIERGTLVPLLGRAGAVAMRLCLFTAEDAGSRTEVRDFRAWLLQDAAPAGAPRSATDAARAAPGKRG